MDENQAEIVAEQPEAAAAEVVEQTEGQESEASAKAPETPKNDNLEAREKRRSFEGRINEVTRKMHEQRERADEMTRRYNDLVKEIQARPLQRDQFKDDQAFADAYYRQQTKISALEVLAEQANENVNKVASEQQKAIAESWSAAIVEVSERIPDWHAVVSGSKAPTTPVMDQAIMENEMGPEIAYYLAKHPGEAMRIYQLSPKAQEREIVRLESRISNEMQPTRPSAPAPIKPIPAASKAITSPADEYHRYEAEQNKINRYGSGRR